MFEALLIFGAAGFLLMTALGFMHWHGSGGHHGHGHAGHGMDSLGSADSPASMAAGHHAHADLSTVHAPHAGPADPHVGIMRTGPIRTAGVKAPIARAAGRLTPKTHASAGSGLANQLKSLALMFISPLDIFSICLGMGMAGILLHGWLPFGPILTVAAFLCGFTFDLVITRGLLKLAMKFAAEPSEGLEGMVNHVAKAATSFGKDGRGLIELCVDGQSCQVLASLDPTEQSQGIAIRKGDSVIVLQVDAHRNICRVSRDLAPTEPL